MVTIEGADIVAQHKCSGVADHLCAQYGDAVAGIGRTLSGVVWVWAPWEPEYAAQIRFCPFCGRDLMNEWEGEDEPPRTDWRGRIEPFRE